VGVESACLSDKTGGAGSTRFDSNLKRIYEKKGLRDLNLISLLVQIHIFVRISGFLQNLRGKKTT